MIKLWLFDQKKKLSRKHNSGYNAYNHLNGYLNITNHYGSRINYGYFQP